MTNSGKKHLIIVGASLVVAGACLFIAACANVKLNPTGIASAQPTITSISPGFAVAGSSSQQLVISGRNFDSSSSVVFNGTPRSATFINSQQINFTLNSSDLAVAGNYDIAIDNPAPGGSSTPTIFSVWQSYEDPATGIGLAFPVFGTQTQLKTFSSSGSVISFDIQAWSTSLQAFASVVGVSVYPNASGSDLQQWFENNVDLNGILLANNTFQQETFANGVTALIISGPVPTQYLDGGSPVEQVYALTPSGKYIVTMTEGQEVQFGDYGYQPLTLFPQILGAMKFQ